VAVLLASLRRTPLGPVTDTSLSPLLQMVAAGGGIITGVVLDTFGPGVTVGLSGAFMVAGCVWMGVTRGD
jgi:hypothetical protein